MRKIVSTEKLIPLEPQILALNFPAIWRAFWNERFAFICICFYLFLEYVKPEQQYPILGILPFLRLSILGALLGVFADKTSRAPWSLLHSLFLLYFLHCVLTSINAYRPDMAFENLNLIYLPVLIFFLVTAIVNSEKRLFIFVLIFFLANFRMSQYGFLSWVKRGFSFASYGVTGAGWFRNSGEFGMEMAMFFAYTICFVFFLRHHWQGWVKWLMYFLPVTAVACVIASSSRGAVLGMLCSLFYLSMFAKKKFKASFFTALLGVVVYIILPDEFLSRFQSAGQDTTSLSRIYYWGKARLMLSERPIFGVGFYNWVPYFQDYYYDETISGHVELAHNTFLQMGAELGYPGVIIFVVMLIVAFIINIRSEQMSREPGFEFLRSFAIGMNAAGAALVASSMFLTATYIPSFWIHFTLTICLRNAVAQKRMILARAV